MGFPGVPCHRGGEKPAQPILTPGSGATMGRVQGRPSWSSTTKVMNALLMCLRLTDISWPYASAQTPTSMLRGRGERKRGKSRREGGMGTPATSTHLFLKALLTMALSTRRSPTCDGPRKWNISMARSVGWAWHSRLVGGGGGDRR